MGGNNDRGYAGEQSMGFAFGEQGYFFIEGPGGAAGHDVNARGFDGVAYNPEKNILIIYDNKSFASSRNVGASKASSIDPRKNLLTNLDDAIANVDGLQYLPNRAKIRKLLQATRDAVDQGRAWPSQVKIAITNAGGRSAGVTKGFSTAGITFIDYYKAPDPKTRGRVITGAAAVMAVEALSGLMDRLSDKAIEDKVRQELKALRPAIKYTLSRGQGALIHVHLREWEQRDDRGKRGRAFVGVHLYGGYTRQLAEEERNSSLLPGVPEGWVPVHLYTWIPAPWPAETGIRHNVLTPAVDGTKVKRVEQCVDF